MSKAMTVPVGGGVGVANGIKTGIDWQKADLQTEEGRTEIAKAMTDYFNDLRGNKQFAAQKNTRTGHLGTLPSVPDIDVRFYGPAEDFGVLSMFRYVDKTSSKNSTHQIANVDAGGIVFEQKTNGEPARIRKVTDGSPVSVSSVTWQGAIGIDDDASRFDEYDVFEQNVQTVPTKWMDKQASNHVSLLTALGSGVNESWDTDLITTVNNGCAQIVEDVGDTYGLPDRPTFVLLYNHRRWNDVLKALVSNLSLPNDNNSAKQLQFDIMPIQTRKITTTNLYLALPGYDMVTVEWDGLFSEYARDPERGSDNFIWRARQNAAIGNTQQVRRITPA